MSGGEKAFDEYAQSYDMDFTNSHIGMLQRKRVWNYLKKNVSPEIFPDVLELNCGTGEDAFWFSKQGYNVTATDISAEMVEVAKQKLRNTKATVFQSEIQSVHKKIDGRKFNLIFSDFGGMNCLSPDQLSAFLENTSSYLHQGGRMILVVMGRNCKWEQFYFKRKKDLQSAYRRRAKEPVEAIIFGERFSTWYYSPDEIKKMFSKNFFFNSCKPIGIAIPPSYLNKYFTKHPFRLKMLSSLEYYLGNISALSDKADHYIIDFIRK